MELKTRRALQRPQAGFTLIELLVVVLIIGILASIAVPQYFKVVEKGRFAEASTCFSVIKGAQERYFLKNSAYSTNAALLDVTCSSLKNYTSLTLTAIAGPSYTVELTRNVTVATYGAYTVTYTGPAGTYTCSQADCTADLLP
jgi:type IV pilus assembly protein PilE